MRLEVVDVLLVYTFPAVVRIRVVDAFSTVDRSAGSAARGISIALDGRPRVSSWQRIEGHGSRAFDFRLRQAIHALLTHRLLLEAASDARRDLDLVPRV